MKINTPVRVAPDETHMLESALFGDEDRFELSTIRPEDASIAMEMLIGNYAAPIDAVIRELYVNASDSHRAVGQTRPVEITMPTEDSPFFVVRDFGLGMSPEDMVGIFTRPAASTKRGENTSTGGLGIGAKSPFTVTDRFVVRSVKDGVAATLIMARIDGHLTHLVDDVSAAPDAAPNGVEVTVPVEVANIDKWWSALSRVHFWWDEGGAVITNKDESPVALPTWSERILEYSPAPALPAVVHNRTLKSPVVLMGQIAYSIPPSALPTREALVYVVPVDTVSIAPTRESIVDTRENRNILADLLCTWQEEQFVASAEAIMDPATSMVGLVNIQRDLGSRGLNAHFDEWLRSACMEKIQEGLLPRYGIRHMVLWSSQLSDDGIRVHLHGVPDQTARARSIAHLLDSMGRAAALPTLFVDSHTLSDARRRVLSLWARGENHVVAVADREALASLTFNARWSSRAPEATRRFANPGELEWVDPADIRVERSRRTTVTSTPTNASPIEVMDLSTHRRGRTTFTVAELVEEIKKRPNRWALIDTVAEIGKIDVRLPKNIVAVPSGQRAAGLLRKQLGGRALTVLEFKAKQAEYVLRSLTKAQKRSIADATIARVDRVSHFFHGSTTWIEQTEDPEVRAIAEEISTTVTRAYEEFWSGRRFGNPTASASDFTAALDTVLHDPDWLLEHASLAKFAPALFAAQATGLSMLSWRHTELVVEHIRSTIAAQLVTR